MTNTAGWILVAGLTALSCSSQTFTSASGDAGGDGGGESTGGTRSTGGASGSAGRVGTGGARVTGGASATGGTASGGRTGTGGVPNSTGGIVGDGGGSSSDSGVITTDSGVVTSDSGSGIACWGAAAQSFPTFEKGCGTDTNCSLVQHQTDCCGSILVMAVNHSAVGAFDAAEAICRTQYPGCGCAPQGTKAEDGVLVPFGKENLIVAKCGNGVCGSTYSGQRFACGTTTCPDTDFCSVTVPGVPGVPPSYQCTPLFGCNTCSCLGTSSTCQCTQGAVGITRTCYEP